MEYVHRAYVPGETIAAISTPPGEGGVAIIRISGHDALGIAEKIFSGPIRSYKTHTAHFGKIFDSEGKTLDEVLVLVMLNPRSYTGEDTIEIHDDAFQSGQRVLVLDDLLATGGTAKAVTQLIESCGAKVECLLFLIELTFLKGRAQLNGYEVLSLIQY